MRGLAGHLSKAGRILAFMACLAVMAGAVAPAVAQPSTGDVLNAVVQIRSEIDPAARTAKSLGYEREGYGVVIDSNGLVLTIGYLILEATSVTVTGPEGVTQPATVVAYDYNTGLGLLRTAQPLPVKPMRLGDSQSLAVNDDVLVAGFGGGRNAIRARVVARRDFTGYWEYLLPNAIFTHPVYRAFGGAALVSASGKLVGIGSLVVGDAMRQPAPRPGNMFVPIEVLKPILGQLIATGRSEGPRRPWIGVYTQESRNRVLVVRLAADGPGAAAGVARGDTILAVAGKPVRGQVDFYRKLWALGPPGVAVSLTVLRRDGGLAELTVTSGDRYDWLRLGAGN